MKKTDKFIKNYQCSGCIKGSFPECFTENTNGGIGCENHFAGTGIMGLGKIFLGMPKGFNRLGECDKMKPYIFETFKSGWGYDMFNVPVWKYLKDGHTFVRGISPRINTPFIHVYLENCIEQIKCLEITEEELSNMD